MQQWEIYLLFLLLLKWTWRNAINEGGCGIGHKTPARALSMPLNYVTLGGTTVFSDLHGTVKLIFLQRWLYLLCVEEGTWIFCFKYLNTIKCQKLEHSTLRQLMILHLCLWVPLAGQGSISSISDPGYMTWAHYTCGKSLFPGRRCRLRFVPSPPDLLLPS